MRKRKTKVSWNYNLLNQLREIFESLFLKGGFFVAIILFSLGLIFQSHLLSDEERSVEITVDASYEIGNLPEVWHPGIDIGGRGDAITALGFASDGTLEMWDEEIGSDRGLQHVFIKHWRFLTPGADLEVFAGYLSRIVQNGGDAIVRLVGTPEYLRDPEVTEDNWFAYAPRDFDEWEDFIYYELEYLVAPTNVTVNNYNLFHDYNDHYALGLSADKLWFSLWYGIWGWDAFQWRDTDEDFFALWNATYQAAKRIEDKYGVDIKLGGFGFSEGNSGQLFGIDPYEIWDDYTPPGYGGFIYNLIAYSSDPGPDEDDRISIDWIDYQFRHPNPFAISQPQGWWDDNIGQLETFLELFGYDPDYGPNDPEGTQIMANVWHGQARVNGVEDSFGRPLEAGVEANCEIDAGLYPARIFDMEVGDQEKQVREAIQDFSDVEDPWTPLFREFGVEWGGGGIGVTTLGLESEGWMGLKKATYNSLKLIDMLGDIKLNSASTGEILDDDRYYTVNAYATKKTEDNSLQVLVWTYVSPCASMVGGCGSGDKVAYQDLYDDIEREIGGEYFNLNLSIHNLEALNSPYFGVKRYLIDKYNSNSFEYRNQICNAMGLERDGVGECLDSDIYNYSQIYTIEEINNWTLETSPEGIPVSVALEVVEEDDDILNQGTYNLELALLPYSVMLLVLTPESNEAPMAIISQPANGEIFKTGEVITFDGSQSSDPEGQALTYHWDFGDGQQAGGMIVTHTYNVTNNYTVTLTVTDELNGTSQDSIQIVIENLPPQIEITQPQDNSTFLEGEAIILQAQASDPEDGNLTNNIIWVSNLDGELGTGGYLERVLSIGNHTITASVTDSYGNLANDAVDIVIQDNLPPFAIISQPENNDTFYQNEEITFDGSQSFDPEGEFLTYHWDFGDNKTANGAVVTHIYELPNTYTVTLTVTDELNQTSQASIQIEIREVEYPTEVGIELVPPADLRLSRGETTEFSVIVKHYADDFVVYDLWLNVVRPNGREVLIPTTWLNGQANPRAVIFDGPGSVEINYTATVPLEEPYGQHTLIANVGDYSTAEIMATDSFMFKVTRN